MHRLNEIIADKLGDVLVQDYITQRHEAKRVLDFISKQDYYGAVRSCGGETTVLVYTSKHACEPFVSVTATFPLAVCLALIAAEEMFEDLMRDLAMADELQAKWLNSSGTMK